MSTTTTATVTALPSSSLTAVLLLLTSLFITLEAATESLPSACADELVRFSPCLSYVASPPNNLSDLPPPKCCDVFSSAADSGRAVCLCYLVQDPPMLGFPVIISRVFSLSSVCPRRRNSTAASTSLQSLCSESPGLPPLRNTTIPVTSSPPPPPPIPTPSPPHPPPSVEPASPPSPIPANKSSTKPSFLTPPSFSIPPSSAVEPPRLPFPSSASMKRFFKSNSAWILPAISIIILI